MSRCIALAAVVLGLTAGDALAAAAPRDFAYGLPLRTDPAEGLHRLAVPGAVYEAVASSGLADVRVFNAAGEPIPHLIRPPASGGSAGEQVSEVPFFPLQGVSAGEGANVTVTTSDDGSVVSIQRSGSDLPDAETEAYLVDLSALERRVQSLRLSVAAAEAGNGGLDARLTVDASDDLSRWRTLRRGAPLMRLDYQGHRLEQTTVTLPGVTADYLRIGWPPQARGYRLTGVEAVAREAAAQPAWRWLRPTPRAAEEADVFHYDTSGRYPVRRVEIAPGYENAVLNVRLDSRPDPEAQWRRRFAGEVYRVQRSGTTLRNEAVTVPETSDRYWRISVAGPVAAGPAPDLRLGWRPGRLYFVAQGPGPYMLAFGSTAMARTQPGSALSNALLRSTGNDSFAAAGVGERTELGGPARLRPAPQPLPWTRILLWGVLLLAVAVLGFMAWRLSRQLGGAGTG